MNVVDSKNDRVKIHFVVYGEEYDKWRNKDNLDLVHLLPQVEDVYISFELHREQTFQIKLSLKSVNWKDPDVRLKLQFDKILFERGLKKNEKASAIISWP